MSNSKMTDAQLRSHLINRLQKNYLKPIRKAGKFENIKVSSVNISPEVQKDGKTVEKIFFNFACMTGYQRQCLIDFANDNFDGNQKKMINNITLDDLQSLKTNLVFSYPTSFTGLYEPKKGEFVTLQIIEDSFPVRIFDEAGVDTGKTKMVTGYKVDSILEAAAVEDTSAGFGVAEADEELSEESSEVAEPEMAEADEFASKLVAKK